ncbi:MAG: hypothetical protein IJD02_02010 [Lachnospiraceae bacterium]|nr:hypothetical protein [Lachnospiraceae bacterium]
MIYVNVCIISLIVLFNIALLNYGKKESEKSGFWKRGILPGQLFIYDKIVKNSYLSHTKVVQDGRLLGIETNEEKLRFDYARRLTLANLIIVAVCVIGILVSGTKGESNIIEKPEYYDGSQNLDIKVDIDNTKGIMSDEEEEIIEDSLTITVEPARISEKEFYKLVDDVVKYIYEELPGENQSLDKVENALNFVDDYPDNNEVSIVWIPDEEGYIDSKGNIDETPKDKDVVVQILAIISCQGYETTVPIDVCVIRRDLSSMEMLHEFINISVEEQNKDLESKVIELPKDIGGVKLSYPMEEDNTTQVYLILMGVTGALIVVLGKDYENRRRVVHIKERMIKEYSNIVSKLIILMKSGMSIINAWKRVSYENAGYIREEKIYDLMKLSVREMESGVTAYECFKNFGIRAGSEPYVRLVTYINQNMSKGTGEILSILEMELVKACEERKNMILRAGEKASTKMIFPMIMLLIIIMAITVIPAIIMM